MITLRLRRAWLQIHKWIGLALAVLIVPLCLSGSALVWKDAADQLINPARYATTGEALLPPGRYAAAARARLGPDERIARLIFPAGDGPVTVEATRPSARGGRPARTTVWLDPPSARVLDAADSGAGAMRVVHILHGSLMMPGVGRTIVGWIGVAMMLSCLTGLWLWAPVGGRWARGLRWRRRPHLDANLHHLAGFWIALPLFALSLTGAWIALPGLFGRGEGRPARSAPVARPVGSADAALGLARQVVPGRVAAIDWPTEATRRWTVTVDTRSGADLAVSLADGGGAIGVAAARPHGGPGVAGAMRRLHDGTDMGPVWQIALFVAGLVPALLAVTGVVMWVRARRWRGAVRRRRGPAAAGRARA